LGGGAFGDGMSILAFTGTRKGMTAAQRRTLRARFMGALLGNGKRPSRVHHGRCVGGDEDVHDLLLAARIPVETWPGHIPELRAPCLGAEVDHPPMDCIERNHVMVGLADYLIAAPAGYKEAMQSGTWATCRWARDNGKPVFVVWPDGRLEKWGGQ
jgi:hypothetical protein